MSLTKTSALILSAAAIGVLTVGTANAKGPYNKHASATHATQSTLSDNNAPVASLSAREFFERISGNSR